MTVDGPEYETAAGVGSNLGIFVPAPILEMNFYCDTYGIMFVLYLIGYKDANQDQNPAMMP